MDAQVLPGNARSIVHPFLSLVLNINVATKGHRDRLDKTLCVVLALGEYLGGALGMYEAGLVAGLRSGDFAAFISYELTHFNLHYTGYRASMVFHTDKEIEVWTHGGRNGWEANENFL